PRRGGERGVKSGVFLVAFCARLKTYGALFGDKNHKAFSRFCLCGHEKSGLAQQEPQRPHSDLAELLQPGHRLPQPTDEHDLGPLQKKFPPRYLDQ
ncbi:hypothetical protein ACV4W3_28275, partial [Pseudomonas aeruginosa]